MQRRPLAVRFRQAGRPERQTARQKRQNYAPQNSGRGRSPTHGPDTDSQRIGAGGGSGPQRVARGHGPRWRRRRRRRLSFDFPGQVCWAENRKKDRHGGGERGRRPGRSPGVAADQSQDRRLAGLSRFFGPELSSPPNKLAGLAWRRAGRAITERRKASCLVGRSGSFHNRRQRVAHSHLLDPWRLARACFGLPLPLPRSLHRKAGQPSTAPAPAIVTRRAETLPRTGPCAAPRGGSERDGARRNLGRRDGQGESLGAKAGSAGLSLERGPDRSRHRATARGRERSGGVNCY